MPGSTGARGFSWMPTLHHPIPAALLNGIGPEGRCPDFRFFHNSSATATRQRLGKAISGPWAGRTCQPQPTMIVVAARRIQDSHRETPTLKYRVVDSTARWRSIDLNGPAAEMD